MHKDGASAVHLHLPKDLLLAFFAVIHEMVVSAFMELHVNTDYSHQKWYNKEEEISCR